VEAPVLNNWQKRGLFFVFVCVLIAAAPAFAEAQNETGIELTPQGQVTSGARQFRTYCAQCHGLDGKGDGPVAPSLKKQPADLTVLSKNNHGVFPYEHVFNTITGKDVVASHGTREMPIWSQVFALPSSTQSALGAGGNVRSHKQVDARIKMMVAYIQSIQEK
jgi:mono/diheme cytochrome c family protein